MCERQPPPPLLFVKNPSRGIDNYINDECVKSNYRCIVLNSRPHTIGLLNI